MAELKSMEVINRFYNEVCKEKYPQLSKRQIIDVCYSPFRFLRIAMARQNLPVIRLKNLGKFEPNSFYILKYLRKLDTLYLGNYIPRDRYEYLKKVFIDHVNRRIREIDEEYNKANSETYDNGLPRKNKYKVDEYEYTRLLNHYKQHLKYEALVPVKEDDLKSYSERYTSIPNR